MSLHAGVNVTLCRYLCHFMHASVSLHTGVNVTVCRCQCHVMHSVNVTLFRCQCHFMPGVNVTLCTVSMSLYARVNVTLCRCRCHSVQVWNSNMMRDELMGVVRIDRTHRDHQRNPRARVDGKERSGHKATWNSLCEVTRLIQPTGAVDIHLGVWTRCRIWVWNPDDRSGCLVQMTDPGVRSRCRIQVLDPGVGSRCRIQVFDPKRIKVSGSDVT